MKAEYAKRVAKWVSNDSLLLPEKKINLNNLLTFCFFASAQALLCCEKEKHCLTF